MSTTDARAVRRATNLVWTHVALFGAIALVCYLSPETAFGSSAWLPLSRLGVLLFAAALTTLVIVLVGSVRSGHLHAITLALLAAITLDVQIPILFFSQPASLEHLQGDLGVPWFLVPLAFAVLVGLTVPCLVRLRHTSSMARTAGITVNQLGDP